LGYSADEVVAIGDNDNDISMLMYAGLGVAMFNASAAVKQAAQLTTVASNDDAQVLADLLKNLFPAK
jgi:hydroxymethylpyrimidine pyrophosphatase-like HAD family hydrolase